MQSEKYTVLGAGISGLSAGLSLGARIFEKESVPGGVCRSYYVGRQGERSFARHDAESYRFEYGGGHWIFGADPIVRKFLDSLSDMGEHSRDSNIYLPDLRLTVPYPIQNSIGYLPKKIRANVLKEILIRKGSPLKDSTSLKAWLLSAFGESLCREFFFPFHELYTAGAYGRIAPQDGFKTPINYDLIIKGAKREKDQAGVGYNAVFVYPKKGLDAVINKMAGRCRVDYDKEVVRIDVNRRKLFFRDGSSVKYNTLVSTLPLDKMVKMAALTVGRPDPYTSVLVINVGAKKGVKCPGCHWQYVPASKAGFHRVGFYSNVDNSFLPRSAARKNDRVSVYVEKAYPGGKALAAKDIRSVSGYVAKELVRLKYILEPEIIDPTWVPTAYTWRYPGSGWREAAVNILRKNNIYQIGRYGKWKFQGIAESIYDGLNIGKFINE